MHKLPVIFFITKIHSVFVRTVDSSLFRSFTAVILILTLLTYIALIVTPESEVLQETAHTIGNGGNTAFTDGNSTSVTATISNISLTKDSN